MFLNTAKAGSETAAISEAIGRLISYVLRIASPVSPLAAIARGVSTVEGDRWESELWLWTEPGELIAGRGGAGAGGLSGCDLEGVRDVDPEEGKEWEWTGQGFGE